MLGEPAQGAHVPSRSLLPRMADVTNANIAYVRTDFAIGPAYYFSDTGEVLAALHTILSPSGELPAHVSVGIPQSTLDNILQTQATPIADDVRNDLVLLRISGFIPASASAPPTTDQDVPSVAPPCASEAVLAARHRKRSPGRETPHHALRRPALYHAARNSTASLYSMRRNSIPVHVVWDGPLPRK